MANWSSLKPLTAGMAAYMDVLARVATGINLVVTSAERTPESQAAAMLAKYQAKGKAELYKVYARNKAIIDKLLAAPKTQSAWASIIKKEGTRLSKHLWKGALDLRIRNLTATQVDKLKAAVTATGGKPYLEYDHLHVDLPEQYALMSGAQAVAEVAIKNTKRGVAIMAGTGLAALLIWWLLRGRKARRVSAHRQIPVQHITTVGP